MDLKQVVLISLIKNMDLKISQFIGFFFILKYVIFKWVINMILGFASDHRGFELKEDLKRYFEEHGYKVVDYGTNSEDSCDYPDFAYKLGNGILSNEVHFGIAICGSGIGMSIALNKMKGIYCAKISNPEEALHTRLDNNTNCIALSAKTDLNNAILSIETFITTEYSYYERHDRRNKKVKQIESGEYRG